MFKTKWIYSLIFTISASIFSSHVLFASFDEQATNIENALEGAQYVFCVDGGGSKTALQVLDEKGVPQLLYKEGKESYLMQGECSNIVVVGQEGVEKVFSNLFNDLKIGPQKEKVKNLIPKSSFLGGFAGAGRENHRLQMVGVVKSLGFKSEKISVHADAALALELVGPSGAVLISGTGSICFVKENGVVNRFGGLGYRIGDDGSGYYMGLRAIKAALQEEYRYGQQTSLTPLIKDLFEVDSVIKLIGPINGNLEPPGKIASIAPLVFQEAWKGDAVAYLILEQAANELGQLLAYGVENAEIKHCLTYLTGGLFQNENAGLFIQLLCKSPAMQKLSKGSRPLLVNISDRMAPSLVAQNFLKKRSNEYYKQLACLPISDEPPFSDVCAQFNKEFLTTGPIYEGSYKLSQTFYEDHLKGLELIQKLDYSTLVGAEEFAEKYHVKVAQKILKKLKAGGRVFFVGAGGSGRLSLDLAAKWREFWTSQESSLASSYKDSVYGIIAGGAPAFLKSNFNVKDSEAIGYKAIKEYDLTSKDVVVLISASGTSSYNIGVGTAACEAKATCFFFHNSTKIPSRPKEFLKKYSVQPICIDIGPQTIAGSTGLQAASLAKLVWGGVLEDALCNLIGSEDGIQESHALTRAQTLKKTWDLVAMQLSSIEEIVNLEIEVFSNEQANFWKACDETYNGYVSFLAAEDCLREIMADTTQTSPSFSANPPRSKEERGLKKAEYRAYLYGDQQNLESWEALIGRPIYPEEEEEVLDLLISMQEQGYGDFISRTVSNENLIIGVLSSSLDSTEALNLSLELTKAKEKGLKTAAIVIEEEGFPLDPELLLSVQKNSACVLLSKVPYDHLHLMRTLALKQVLSLISNGAMLGMNKVYGNVMIDVNSSNYKHVDRSIRIVQEIYTQEYERPCPFDYELLYHAITRAYKYKKLMEGQLGKYVPSPTKLALTMLARKCDVEQAVYILKMNNENIQLVLNEI